MVSSFSQVFLASLLLTIVTAAQSTPPLAVPQLSPQSAYDQVMRPLEITRRSIANWSDAETTALAIAVKQAAEACVVRAPQQFSGDELIAYARLCALGQQWPTVLTAATRYITSNDAKPQLAQAYAYQVGATLHTNDPKAILTDSLAMLNAVPYTSIADETLNGALHYLQFAFTPNAITLYAARQPILLSALRSTQHATPATATETPVPVNTLYADGLAYAALQQFAGDPQSAAKTVAELDGALPTGLPPDESIPLAETRRQYALLGTHLPAIPLTLSLFAPNETPRINSNYGNSTVLFLFPDWCAQCVRLASQLLPTMYRINQGDTGEVHLYGLLAQPAPPVAAAPKTPPKPATARSRSITSEPAAAELSKTASEQLRGTPTLIVPPATLALFAATDFPLLIATDHNGIIRFIQPANETALNPGDFLDQITMHIAEQWPPQTSPIATKPATPPQP